MTRLIPITALLLGCISTDPPPVTDQPAPDPPPVFGLAYDCYCTICARGEDTYQYDVCASDRLSAERRAAECWPMPDGDPERGCSCEPVGTACVLTPIRL